MPLKKLPVKSLLIKKNTFLLQFLVLLTLTSLHFLKVAKLIPPPSLLNDAPITENRHSQILADVLRSRSIADATTDRWAYDPSQMAGYPAGDIIEMNSRPAIFFDKFFKHQFSVTRTIKWTLFLSFFLTPLLFYFTARNFGCNRNVSLLALAIALAGFGYLDFNSLLLLRYGWGFYLCASFFGIYAISLLYRMHSQIHSTHIYLLGAATFLTLLYDAPTFLLTLLPMGYLYVRSFSKIKPSCHVGLGLVMGLALFGHWFWLGALIDAKAYLIAVQFQSVSLINFLRAYFPVWGSGFSFAVTIFRMVLIVFFVLGLRFIWVKNKPLVITLVLWCVSVLVLVAVGNHIPGLYNSTSLRMMSALPVAFVVPCVFCVVKLFPARISRALIFFFVLIGVATPVLPFAKFFPFRTWHSAEATSLINQLKNLPKQGRILVEDNGNQAYIPTLLPSLTRQAYLGLPGVGTPLLQHKVTEFQLGSVNSIPALFGKALSEYDHHELRNALDLYNVHYVVVFSSASHSFFGERTQVFQFLSASTAPARIGSFFIYTVRSQSSSYLYKGKGKVDTHMNQITIQNPSQGEIILKFHWLSTLQTPPSVEIYPYTIENHPLSLVRLVNNSNLKQISIINRVD